MRPFDVKSSLNLDTELRFHLAQNLHEFVAGLLAGDAPGDLALLAGGLNAAGLHLRITRDLETAKGYLRERYAEDTDARFGLFASSKDRDLVRFGIPNDSQSTKRISSDLGMERAKMTMTATAAAYCERASPNSARRVLNWTRRSSLGGPISSVRTAVGRMPLHGDIGVALRCAIHSNYGSTPIECC
jgi:hypothetical protein